MKKNRLYWTRNMIPILCLFGTCLSFASRTVSEAQAGLFSSDNLLRMAFLPLAFFSILYFSWKWNLFRRVIIPAPLTWIFLFWFLSAFAFLNNNWLSYSFVKWVEYFVAFMGAVYVASMTQVDDDFSEKALNAIKLFVSFLILTVLVGIIVSPTKALYTGENSYSAIRNALLPILLSGWIIPLSSTSVGMLSGILFYVLIVEKLSIRERASLGECIWEGCLIACIILSQSRTAIFSVALAFLVYFLFFYRGAVLKLLLFFLGIVVVVFGASTIMTFLLRGQSRDLLFSLSGRAEWWTYAWNYFLKSSWFCKFFGNGFAAGEKLVAAQSNAVMYTLDSEWFAILISNGLLGVFLYLMFWLSTIKQIFTAYCIDRSNVILAETVGVLLIIFVRTFTVTTLAVHSYYVLICFFAICALCHTQEQY